MLGGWGCVQKTGGPLLLPSDPRLLTPPVDRGVAPALLAPALLLARALREVGERRRLDEVVPLVVQERVAVQLAGAHAADGDAGVVEERASFVVLLLVLCVGGRGAVLKSL